VPNSIVYARLIDTRDPTAAGYLGTLDLTPANGYVPQGLQIDAANTRVVSENWTDRNGANDTTLYNGSRAVTFTVALLPERVGTSEQALREELGLWLNPALRPRLQYQLEATDAARSVVVRYDQGAGFTVDFTQPSFTGMAIGWVAPSGVTEATDDVTVSVAPGGNQVELGRSYSLSFDRTYPAQTPSGTGFVVNDGNTAVFPLIRLYGPCTNPIITNRTANKTLRFTANGGITLAGGDYIEVNMLTRTVFRTGDPTNSYLSRLDFTLSEWWSLTPGANTIAYSPATFGTSAAAIFVFRPAYL
jgi:hypothetical protein